MIGGLRGTASRLAIAAVFCVMGAAVFVQKPAKAADLGGDCCADLEERVAELEATTVRKGNKKVSITVYGKVNYALESWNDGSENNTYLVNNYMESTRMGFKGSAKITSDWSAGYRLEWEFRHADSQLLNQFNDDNAADPNNVNVRWSQMFLASKTYGELRWGLTATPKYDITKDTMEYISTEAGEGGGLSDTMVADFRMNDTFRLRPKGFDGSEGLSNLTWSNIARCYSAADQFNCSTRRNGVAYWSPSWQGFSTSWGWFEDDDWGGALRYKNTSWADTWAFAASVGYEKLRDERLQNAGGGMAGFSRDFDEWAGSAALKHKPTGLFVFGAWGVSDSNDSNAIGAFNNQGPPEMTSWNIQAGIQRKMPWFGLDKLGETAFWGGYSDVNNGFAQGSSANGPTTGQATGALGAVPANGLISSTVFPTGVLNSGNYQVVGTDVRVWTLALDQQLEAAAMHLYAVYQHFEEPDLNLLDINNNRLSVPLDGFDLVYVGGRLYF